MKKAHRLNELDALRGIAALFVVLYHYINRYEALYGHEKKDFFLNFNFGHLGVQLFFIISGFVIFLSLSKGTTTKDFIVKRAIRLYPAYILAVILTFGVSIIYALPERTVSFETFLVNLTMFQGFFFIPHVDGAYWTLTVELFFYIFIGIIFAVGLLKKIEYVSIAWLVFSFAIKVLSVLLNNEYIQAFDTLVITNFCHLFIAGIMFYQIKNNGKLIHHLIIFFCLLYQIGLNPNIESLIVAGFFFIFYLLIFGKLKFLDVKPLRFLGVISFSLYLLHQNIGYTIIRIMESYGLVSEIYIVIPLTIIILLASLLTYKIEKPIQKKLLDKYRQKKKSLQPSHL